MKRKPLPALPRNPPKVSNLDLCSPRRYHAPMYLDLDGDLEESKTQTTLTTTEPPSSVRSRSKAQSFVFVSDDVLNELDDSKMHILEEVSPHSILQQLSVNSSELRARKINKLCHRNTVAVHPAMDNATRYFYNFLKDNKLEKYFAKFEENECCDIRDIEYLIDVHFFKNVIGITNPIHIKKVVALFTNLKHKMDDFKVFLPDVLITKLSNLGIVTMDILCSEIESKSDLTQKLHIHNANQCQLLWSIIDLQINPRIMNAHANGTHIFETNHCKNEEGDIPTSHSPVILAAYDPDNYEFEVMREPTPTPGR